MTGASLVSGAAVGAGLLTAVPTVCDEAAEAAHDRGQERPDAAAAGPQDEGAQDDDRRAEQELGDEGEAAPPLEAPVLPEPGRRRLAGPGLDAARAAVRRGARADLRGPAAGAGIHRAGLSHEAARGPLRARQVRSRAPGVIGARPAPGAIGQRTGPVAIGGPVVRSACPTPCPRGLAERDRVEPRDRRPVRPTPGDRGAWSHAPVARVQARHAAPACEPTAPDPVARAHAAPVARAPAALRRPADARSPTAAAPAARPPAAASAFPACGGTSARTST